MQRIDPGCEGQPMLRQDPLQVFESLATTTECRRQQEIYCQSAPVEYRYRVVAGAARRFAIQPGGRRQIVDFLLPGDFFGFAPRDEHAFTVEAVVGGTVIARYPRARLEKLVDADPRLGRLIRELTAAEISRLQARILLLGLTTSLEKVSAFLLEMAERSSDEADRIVLPMSRYDIADYLAISVETVSRALTGLRQRGTIKLAGTRRVRILDRGALEDGEGDESAMAHPTEVRAVRGACASAKPMRMSGPPARARG